jgi:hypothetical protein
MMTCGEGLPTLALCWHATSPYSDQLLTGLGEGEGVASSRPQIRCPFPPMIAVKWNRTEARFCDLDHT